MRNSRRQRFRHHYDGSRHRGRSAVLRIDALYISERAIRLDGYDWGLIGGCCGLIDKNVLAFTGALDSLESGGLIRDFLSSHGVTPVELTNRPMLDIGGILPLREIAGPGEENGTSVQK